MKTKHTSINSSKKELFYEKRKKELFYSQRRSSSRNATKKELFYNDFSQEWSGKINNLETKKRIKVVFNQLFTSRDLKNKNFLEVGCGLGYFSEVAYKKGAKVTGIDVGDKLVKLSKDRVRKGKFLIASASKLPFKDKTFDTVLCTEVIEHVDKQKKAISELTRVVKTGGVLVVTTPNKVFKPLFNLLSFLRIRPYHGLENWFYSWELRNLFLLRGMKVEKNVYFNFLFPNYFLDKIEKIPLFKHATINFGFKLKKI